MVGVETVAAVEKCCHRVDDLEETVVSEGPLLCSGIELLSLHTVHTFHFIFLFHI